LLHPVKPGPRDTSTTQIVPTIKSHELIVQPFRLLLGRQIYALQQELRIDLREIETDLYQVHIVQDFWTDDDNPNLNECIAGVFLGRRRENGMWEEPERWPIECRSLMILGVINTRQLPYNFTPTHGD
jgi:hypothetical protein